MAQIPINIPTNITCMIFSDIKSGAGLATILESTFDGVEYLWQMFIEGRMKDGYLVERCPDCYSKRKELYAKDEKGHPIIKRPGEVPFQGEDVYFCTTCNSLGYIETKTQATEVLYKDEE